MRWLVLLLAALFLAQSEVAFAQADVAEEDPLLSAVVRQRRSRLERHSLLSKLGLRRVEREGHVWYIQMRPGDPETRIDDAIRRLDPWAKKTEELFDEHIAVPAKFEELGPRLPLATVVLASRGDYYNFYELQAPPCPIAAAAIYDAYIAVTVTYDEAPTPIGSERHGRWGSRAHAWVHALHHAYARIPEKIGGPAWIEAGLAGYLVRGDAVNTTELVAGHDSARIEEGLARRALIGEHGKGYLMTFDELLGQRDLQTVAAWVSGQARVDGKDFSQAFWSRINSLDGQSALLVADLLHPESAQRENFLRFLQGCMKGDTTVVHFKSALGIDPVQLNGMERDYWVRRLAHLRKVAPTYPLECVPTVPQCVREAAAIVGGSASIGGTPLAGGMWARLGVRDGTSEERLALALNLTSRGEFAEAEALLATSAPQAVDRESEARAERALARVRSLAAEAQAELQARLASGAPLRLRVDDKNVKLELKRIEGERVVVGKNRAEVKSIPLDGVLRAALASEALDGAREPERQQLEAWYLAVRGDRKGLKTLKDVESDDGKTAESDARSAYDLADTGVVLGALDDLCQRGPDGLRDSPAKLLEAIHSLIQAHSSSAPVADRMDVLQVLAREALGNEWGADKAIGSLHPTRSLFDGDLLQLTYEFEHEDELLDFDTVDEYHRGFKSIADGLTRSKDEWVTRLNDGALEMIGHQVLRHRVGFKGETEARVKFKHVDIGAAQLVGMFLSIRNNGTGRTSLYSSEDYYMTFEHDWVVVRTAGDETPMPSYADADKDCYLHYDGSAKASLANAKQTVATMPAKDVPPGVTAIIVTSDWLCRIESLTLRGVVSLDDSPLLREAWISSELKRIGFTE